MRKADKLYSFIAIRLKKKWIRPEFQILSKNSKKRSLENNPKYKFE